MTRRCIGNCGESLDSPSSPERRDFLCRIPVALGALSVPAMRLPGLFAQSAGSEVVAKTSYGRVRGTRKDGVVIFKGIPYAGSPAGDNRFKPAPKLKPWTGIRDALLYGPQAIQPADPAWPKEWKPAISNEDCLFLNVWTQGVGKGRKRPVMFYSHGGGFTTGNGGADVAPQDMMHDGGALARDYDVVVVTHNHRLGLMGYLYLDHLLGEEYAASGAAGMLDIAAALVWVRENIEEFGGDPDRVMIWGESGGGAKTSALTAMPKAEGLFHRASVESGSTLRLRTRESAIETTRAVLDMLGLKETEARDLLKIPPDKLCAVQQEAPRRKPAATGSVTSALAGGLGFSPVVDGHFIPTHPYDPVAPAISAKVPLLVGTNKDETIFMLRSTPDIFSMDEAGLRRRLESTYKEKTGKILEVYRRTRPEASPADLYVAITTAQWMGMSAITMAERKASLRAAPVYMYVFAYDTDQPVAPGLPYKMKAAHAMEIPYKFNHAGVDESESNRAEKRRTSRNMSRAWAAFARTGNPSHDEIPPWPAYTLDTRATMFLDAECRVVNDPYREERLLWYELKL
ncbi:MAG TPA: carboxylesterase family protein [Acidobacteriota bacterium]|nr:carboxylesterase family protein [Acidobacteriota bacterium]